MNYITKRAFAILTSGLIPAFFGFSATAIAAFVIGFPCPFLKGWAFNLYHLLFQLLFPTAFIWAFIKLWHFTASLAKCQEISPFTASLLSVIFPFMLSLYAVMEPEIFITKLLCAPYDCLNTYIRAVFGYNILPLFPFKGFFATLLFLFLIYYMGYQEISVKKPTLCLMMASVFEKLYGILISNKVYGFAPTICVLFFFVCISTTGVFIVRTIIKAYT